MSDVIRKRAYNMGKEDAMKLYLPQIEKLEARIMELEVKPLKKLNPVVCPHCGCRIWVSWNAPEGDWLLEARK